MDDQHLGQSAPRRRRTHLEAILGCLLASLLLVFGGDTSGRLHLGFYSSKVVTSSDARQLVAGATNDTRYLSASERSSRPKLRPGESGDSFVAPQIQTVCLSRRGDLVECTLRDRALFQLSLAYRSRAPPIQHTA